MFTYNATFYSDILKTQILDPTPCSGALPVILAFPLEAYLNLLVPLSSQK